MGRGSVGQSSDTIIICSTVSINYTFMSSVRIHNREKKFCRKMSIVMNCRYAHNSGSWWRELGPATSSPCPPKMSVSCSLMSYAAW